MEENINLAYNSGKKYIKRRHNVVAHHFIGNFRSTAHYQHPKNKQIKISIYL